MAGMGGVIGQALDMERTVRERNDVVEQARFAMGRMVRAVSRTRRLLVPLAENPATGWSESARDVLAVTLDPALDRNVDGFADADNDKDGRVDEDPDADNSNDNATGIVGIDDDGDGLTDEGGSLLDNDEDGAEIEDSLDGIDDDGDVAVDEDLKADMNNDGAPGEIGVDDDGDTYIDEGVIGDDDEDGLEGEDWFDPVVYFLDGTTLIERMPSIDPVDGTDFVEQAIADNVSEFLVLRIPQSGGRAVLVHIILEVTGESGEPFSLATQIRVGSAQ